MRVICAVLLACVGSALADPMIWPLPQSYSNGTGVVTVSPAMKFVAAGTPSADLTAAFARYEALILTHRVSSTEGIASVSVTVSNDSEDLQLGVDESYTLDVTMTDIRVTAKTQFGAYYALETLSQMVVFDFDSETYQIRSAPWKVVDAPRFAHREVLVDTSRHYQPMAELKRIITSLPYAKINTFHWHLVDQQSFPYMSPSYPKLVMGAYSAQERYTQNDVADIVEYARARGVRVVIEVDTPGHAASWCKGYPEVCPSPSCTMPLNPTTNATFDLIEGLFKDLAAVAHDNHMHIGGDEVNTKCWTSTPAVADWMAAKNWTADQTYAYFSGRVSDIVFGLGKSVTGWEELWNHFGTKLDKRTIIQQWLPGSTIVQNATAAGYRVIWSTDRVWYLDGLSVTWEAMYAAEPCALLNSTQCALVMGGGGEMWGETVDASDIEQTVWPRLGAVAERLWSARTQVDTAAATPRMQYFRCLLNQRGIAAAPSKNAHARSAPPGTGSCYSQ